MSDKTINKIGAGIFCVVMLLVLLMCVGCSHNAVNYSDGIGFETTIRPDSGNFGFVFRYGKIFSVAARENTEVEMTGDGQGTATGQASGSASSSGSVKMKIGSQITGYYVDALKAGAKPAQLDKYINGQKSGTQK